jgi:hypothetical protein
MSLTGKRRDALGVLGMGLALALVPNACGRAGTGEPSTIPSPAGTEASAPIGTPQSSVPYVVLPTLLPEAVLNRAPTRVRIRELGIDLPVVAPPGVPNHFPYCNVAEYLPTLSRPGRPGATFIYAHARAGMFLPLLEHSRTNDGRSLLGMEVDVFTNDHRRFTYEVADVNRHVTSLESAYRTTAEQLILQTSEGPRYTVEKTLLIAAPRDQREVSAAEAEPAANPVRCE